MSPLKILKSKKPRHRRRKEVFVLIITASIVFSTILIYTYILNSPVISSDHPKIYITCDTDLLSNDKSINCTFEVDSYDSNDVVAPINSKIRIRGSGAGKGANAWPKKGYRIELSEPKSILGMRKDDDWILFAMYMDYPRTRIKMSMDLWRSLDSTDPTAILPDSEYVTVYLNGEFQGLYLLAEKDDRRLFGLDDAQNNINSSLIFQYRYPDAFGEYYAENWDQDWPNEDDNIFIMDQIMIDLIKFIHNTSDDEFFDPETGIFSIFNKLNLIDFYIYNYFILHQDFWNKNFYVVRNTYPNRFFLIPWDFDRSFGQYIWSSSDANKNQEAEIRSKSEFFDRLIGNSGFMNACYSRWKFLRDELWTNEFLFDMLTEIYEDIEGIVILDTQMWNPYPTITDNEKNSNQVNESIRELYEWISDRLNFCDSYFNYN